MSILSKYTRPCGKNVPGNKSRIFIAHKRNVLSITATAGQSDASVTAITMRTASAGHQFQLIEADFDTVQFTSNGQGGTNYFRTQNIIGKFSALSKDLISLEDDLAESLPCGLVVIRCDNNGKAFISGISIPTKEGNERPWNKGTIEYDSGTIPTDEGTQAMTLTLERMGGYGESPLNATLTNLINKNSATAAFIDW